jgi:eukaryotic translation initiation factor 2C
MPVVDIGPKKRQILVPAELCDIVPGTAYMGKLDAFETSQMIRYACKDPATNANTTVNEGLPKLGLTPSKTPKGPLAAFGIEVSGEMTTITARILPPPTLSYKVGRPNVKVQCFCARMTMLVCSLIHRRMAAGTSWMSNSSEVQILPLVGR